MANYLCRVINEQGEKETREVEAESAEAATAIIGNQGFIPLEVTEKKDGGGHFNLDGFSAALTKVSTMELILFTKQLSSMLRAGIPFIRIFQVLEDQTENLKLKKIVNTIVRDIEEGLSLYEAFKKHTSVFSPLYCNTLQSGEQSGNLPTVLERLIYIISHEQKIKADVKSAMTYPMIVVVFLSFAFIFLLTFVIPKFIKIFIKAKIELPLPTKICMLLYNFLAAYWLVLIGAVFVVILGLSIYFKTGQGRFVRDYMLIKMPLFGNVLVKAAMSRFASIFSIMQASGVPVLDTMRILSGTIGNAAIAREFDRVESQLREGKGISGPLGNAEYFTPMVINMVAIGEESGNLDEMLQEVSKHYDTEVEYAMDKLTAAIGPVLTVALAAVVGFFALSIFLPMWDLTKMVK